MQINHLVSFYIYIFFIYLPQWARTACYQRSRHGRTEQVAYACLMVVSKWKIRKAQLMIFFVVFFFGLTDTSFDAARAAGGIHSPMQGRSVRELEEQMSTLRKENFNLKLRIYFMEEGQHGSRGGKTAADSPAKQLIDSKIEIEILRKRVDEKTELLKDAARAISQHEEMQKKADLESQAMIEQMQQYIQQLEVQSMDNIYIYLNLKTKFVFFSGPQSSAKQKVTKNSMDSLDTEKFKALEAEVSEFTSISRSAFSLTLCICILDNCCEIFNKFDRTHLPNELVNY